MAWSVSDVNVKVVRATYEEEDVATIVAAFDGRVLVAGRFSEVDVVVAPRGILDGLVTHTKSC